MANTQLDNLAGDVTLFQSALEGAKIAVSDSLTPTLREFVQFGSESISTLSDAFKEGGLTGAMDALGEILSDGLAMVLDKAPEMVEAAMAKGIRGFLPLQNYFKRVLSPDYRESKKPEGKRMKEDTQAFLNTPKPLAEKEIPAWVMKAFEESKSEAKQFKEWIDNGSISGKFNQMMYFAKKINDLAGELEGAGEPAVAAKLKSISRELR